jgi:DNA-binding NtrC family response regulator
MKRVALETYGRQASILVVDDDPAAGALVELHADAIGFAVVEKAETAAEGLAALKRGGFDLVVLDLGLPDMAAAEVLPAFLAAAGSVPIAVVTADNRIDTAVRCMREGAFDFLEKPLSPARLPPLFAHATENARLRRLTGTGPAGHRAAAFSRIITRSPLMFDLFRAAERIAPSQLPILVAGESGTGKELLSRTLHDLSGRSGEFVAVNAAGLDGTLFSDVLFGHVRGAYTGAEGVRAGLVKRAQGGTLFLDEIGDIGADIQVKLLRFLQDGEYYPLGADRSERADCRLILATHVDLHEAVRSGRFREDLYYRLTAHAVEIPPLRARREDIGLLADHFAKEAAARLKSPGMTLDRGFLAMLENYGFPGNVRELAAIVHGAVAAAESNRPSSAFVRDYISRHAGPDQDKPVNSCEDYPYQTDGRFPPLEELEMQHIREALRRTGDNQSAAAELLGISQSTISRKLRSIAMQNR